MTFLFFLILFFFILGWVLPRILPRLLAWMIRRRVNSFARRMQNEAEARFGNGGASAEPQPRPRRKKIDPNVGEYVRFEEISVEAEQTVTDDPASGTRRVDTSFTIEEQIVDAEWEDLPPKD